MLCLCCATCYLRRLQRLHHEELLQAMLSPLLPQRARQLLFRNSLYDDGESEWMCIICGFDNKPRNSHCTMCGTSHEFSITYKGRKIEKRRERKQQREEKKKRLEKNDDDLTSPLLDQVEEGNSAAVSENNQTLANQVDVDKSYHRVSTPLKSTTMREKGTFDIPIADEAQISSISLSLKRFQTASADANLDSESKVSYGIEPLSLQKRQEAINFRRMNQLSLRQKSARRRRMWQRKFDEKTGALVWMRVPVKETKVGSAPFGYTPKSSFAESRYWDHSSSYSVLSQEESIARSSNMLDDLLAAAANPPNHVSRQMPQNMFSSPSKIVSAINLNNELNSKRSDQHKRRADSFGDNALISTSPGYTSVFDEQGDLRWEKVVPGEPMPKSTYGPTIARYPLKFLQSMHEKSKGLKSKSSNNGSEEGGNPNPGRLGDFAMADQKFDLPSIAAYTFKDKQIWFLDRMSEMQKPWTEGFIRIEIRRARILDDSHRAWSQLRHDDLHKWMRFQFYGEPGVDAGGLEREWFGLVIEEIFSPAAGLFTRCGSESGGSYHINPISGAINANHLSYFRFVGRILGKAIMEQQFIKANLSLPLRKQLIGIPVTFSDLEFVDDELFRNLVWLSKNDVSSLMLDFSISYTAANQTVTYELVPNGHDIMVTNENKQEYLQLRLRHRLLDSIKLQLENLLLGFYEVIPPELLSVFDYQELDLLLCGIPDIDLDDWIRHTEYMGEYQKQGIKHPIIKCFWNSVRSMGQEERIRLLQFTTGCSRLPVQGFKALQSSDGRYRKFNIQSVSKKVCNMTVENHIYSFEL